MLTHEHSYQEKLKEYARKLLLDCMEEVSEEFWCASWLGGLEYILWDLMVDGKPIPYGLHSEDESTPEYIKSLRDKLNKLHYYAEGWWVLDGDIPSARRFVPESEWLEMLAKRKDSTNAS